MTWHVDAHDLDRYAVGAMGGVGLASVEAHLVTCAVCRSALTTIVHPASDLPPADDAVWAGIVDRVDRGTRTFTRSSRLWQVSLSSPPLAAVTVVLAALMIVGVALARLGGSADATVIVVVVGPLVPLVTARLAFVSQVDPAGRMSGAVPLSGSRVASMRALVSVVVACVAGLAMTPVTTLTVADSMAWLLPALAASSLAVAIGTFVDSTVPSGVFALVWLSVTAAWLRGTPRVARGMSIDGLVSARSTVQVLLVVAIAVGVGVTAANRDGRRVRWSL